MYDKICGLVETSVEINSTGDPVENDVSVHEVFCRVVTADQKEKEAALSRGGRAEYTVILSDLEDYGDEIFVDYNGKRYDVIDVRYGDTSTEIRLVIGRWAQR